MVVCPICEHRQIQGASCEVCGRKLLEVSGAAGGAVPPVEGLEQTLLPQAGAIGTPALLAELEPTHHAPAGYAGEPMPGLQATREAPVDVEEKPGLEIERTTTGIPDEALGDLPALTVCRYCRTPAMEGERICSRCGMKLPVMAREERGPVHEDRLCSCGTPVRGARCPSCGARTG